MQDTRSASADFTDESARSSTLDRRIDVSSLSVQSLLWVGVLVSALGVRLIGRTNWPLSPAESMIARDAYALVNGEDLSGLAASHPATVQITAIMFFLFGDSDYTARLAPLLASLGVIVVLYWMRHRIGTLPALSTAFIWAVSPVMTMSSMRIDGGMLLVLANLTILALVFSMSVEPGPGKPVMLGVMLSIGLTAHPLGWIFSTLVLVLAVLMVRDPEFGSSLPNVLIGFVVTFIIVTTHVLTRPYGIIDFFRESPSSLWTEHVQTIGSGWNLTLIAMTIEEPLALAMAATAIILVLLRVNWGSSTPPALIIACAAWLIPSLTFGFLLGGQGPALYAAALFPLALLGGVGMSMVVEATLASGFQWRRISVAILVGFLLIVAVVRLADVLTIGPLDDPTGWVITLLLLGLLILLPLFFIAVRLMRDLGLAVVPMTLLALALVLGLFSLRNSVLLPTTTQERSGVILVAGSSAPSVAQIERRIRTYSGDTTRYVQDVRDPTGGHGLVIVVDAMVSAPFAWYFRDFPNFLEVEDLGQFDPEFPPDVVIATRTSGEEFVQARDDYALVEYALVRQLPPSLQSTNVGAWLNPANWRDGIRFMLHRDTATAVEFERFALILREDHAESFWGSVPD